MHFEILIEDNSGKRFLEAILPRIFGPRPDRHTWRIIAYKGIGRLPRGLQTTQDPAKRQLLSQLPRLIQGYGRTPGIDAVVVIVDSDKRKCQEFLSEITGVIHVCNPKPNTLVRLAIEELEAWYLGDIKAVALAYPKHKKSALASYVQDSACDTWELLADALHPGGLAALKKPGSPSPGELKHQWAERLPSHMDIECNQSPSFCKLRDGLRRLANIGN